MEWLSNFANPAVIGPMIGLVAVIGWIIITVFKLFFRHQERIEKIRHGMDPDSDEEDRHRD